MQNWNQWPVPSGTVSAPMPPPPTGYTAPGTDPMTTMQAYMQYYNQPPPSGYTPEQWASAQQQNWAQWQQWQQQYQQWQAQYGEKYQETMKQYGVTGQQAPPLPLTSQPPPPPPKDDKPPLPPSGNISSYGYSTGAPPPPPSTNTNITGIKRASGSEIEADSTKKLKENDEELSEAEKTFDAQFKQWEEKFNTWKLQNANHPDKTQYKQYEAKWTSWREKLIERREQMRRKREQQKLAAAAKAESEKKDMPGGDKILNILSSTENQGLINNLLGIGKTLGLTTKQNQNSVSSSATAVPIVPTVPIQQQPMVPPQVAMTPMMQPDMSQAWAQWNQYNPAMNTSMPPMGQPLPSQIPQYSMQHIPMTGPPTHIPPPQPNFSQPPPGFPPVNFSQPPPGFTQPPPPLNTNPPPPPGSQPPININIQQLSKAPPPPILGSSFGNNQLNQQRSIGKDNNQNDRFGPPNINNQFRQGSNEDYNDNQGSNFNNRINRNNRGINRNNFNQGNRTDDFNQGNNQGNRIDYNQGNRSDFTCANRSDFNKGSDDNENRFGVPNRGVNFGRGNQDNYNNDNFDDNYENRNADYDTYNYDRNSYGNKDNNRFVNRQQTNNQPLQEDNMPPELKKLMAKRKAVTDVFKPSSGNFAMDSSSNTSSLSESFKKVSGDKVFGKGTNFRDEKFTPKFRTSSGFDPPDDFGSSSRGKFQDLRGPSEFGSDGSNNFGNRGPNNFGNRGPNEFSNVQINFGNRGQNNFGNRCLNDFGNRGPNNFVNKGPNNFGNKGLNDFGNRSLNKDIGNKDISGNQDQVEASNEVIPDSSTFNNQTTNFTISDNTDNINDPNKIRSFSDKSACFEDLSSQNFLGNKFDCNKEQLPESFSNISSQKTFSVIEDQGSNDFLSVKNNFVPQENQIQQNSNVPLSPQLQKESDFTTDNIKELQCPDQPSNLNEQKFDSTENEKQLDILIDEQQSDIDKNEKVPIAEDIVSLTENFVESNKVSESHDNVEVTESTESINPMIDESAWIPCDDDTSPNNNTEPVKIVTEDDISSHSNQELNEIATNQDTKEKIEFSSDIQQKSNTLPFMGAEDPKAEDMNLQPPPEQPNVAMITTLEEPPTPSFTDEISEDSNFENKNPDKTFRHPQSRSDFNHSNFNDGSQTNQGGSFGRQEPSFKSGQFNTVPPPFGQRGNFNQPLSGPTGSKTSIPSLLTLKIDPPPMMMIPSRSGASDDDLFDSEEAFKHNKSFDAEVTQSNLDTSFSSNPFGFKAPPLNKDGLIDKERNFSSGNFGSNKSLFGKDASVNTDRNFSSNLFGPKNSSFGESGSVEERNFGSGPSGSNKFSFTQDGSIGKDRNFGPSAFGINKPPFAEDSNEDKDMSFVPGNFGSNKILFSQDGSVDKDRNFGSTQFSFNKSTCSPDGQTERDRNFGSGLFGLNKPLFTQEGSIDMERNFASTSLNTNNSPFVKDSSLNKGRNFETNMPSGKDGPLTVDTALGSGLNISPSNELPIEIVKSPGPGLLGVASNLLSSSVGLTESAGDANFDVESNHQDVELTSIINESKKDLDEDSVDQNDSLNNSEQLDADKNISHDLFSSIKHLDKKTIEADKSFNTDVFEFEKIPNKDMSSKHDVNSDSSSFRSSKIDGALGKFKGVGLDTQMGIENRKFVSGPSGTFIQNSSSKGLSELPMNAESRSFGPGQFSSSLQKFSVGSIRNRPAPFDFQASFNTTRSDDAPLISPIKSSTDMNEHFDKTVDLFEKPTTFFDKGIVQFEKPHIRFDKPSGSFDNTVISDKSSSFSLPSRRGMNNDFNNSGPEFCVGKQFNYNHGGIPQDSSLDFLAPKKIIDYSHETRVGVFEFIEPVGIFDYGHGKLKPSVPDLIQDFKNWEETEHNLMEYNEEMRKRIEKVGRMWTSPSRSIDKSLWDDPKSLSKDKKERNDTRENEKDRDDRRRDNNRDERRDRDRDDRLSDRLRDKDRNREKDRDDRYSDRSRSDKDRDDRCRDNDRYVDRSRDKDRDDRYRSSDRDRDRSRDKDRDDRYKDREDRYKDRDDRHKDRDDRYKDRDERYKDRGYEKDKEDRYKDRVDKDLKDKSLEKDLKDRCLDKDSKDKSSEKDLKDKSLEKDFKDKNFEKDSKDRSLEKNREDKNSEKDKDLRTKRDKPPEQKEDQMIIEKSSSPEKNKEQEEKGNKTKELEKNDDRSKGNISWQDSTAIISTDTTSLQDSSLSETKQNALEIPPKIMELPKTPNLTMVDDILCTPGRLTRPPKIAIILRGPPGSGKSFVAKLIKDKEIAQGGSAPRILSIDDYFLVEKDSKPSEDNKKDGVDEMEYKYEEAMEPEYVNHLFKAFKKNITDGFFNFIILDSINEKISDYEEMWSFAKTKGFKVFVCEMEMDVQICLKRNIHKRLEDEINRIVDYFEPAPSHHHKLDVTALLQEQAIEDVEMEDVQDTSNEEVKEKEKEKEKEQEKESLRVNDDSQDSQEDAEETGVSKWEKMEAEDKLDRLDGLKRKHDNGPQTMEEFLQVPDYYNADDNSGKKHVRWADLEERKQQEKMRAVGFVVGHTNWNRMMDPTHGGSALTRTKYI